MWESVSAAVSLAVRSAIYPHFLDGVLSVPRRDAPCEAPACERLFFRFRPCWLIQRRRRAGRFSVGPANILLHDNAVAPRTAV